MLGNQVCAPVELPANQRHLDTYFANLTLTDKSFHVSAIGRGRALDGIEMMAIARGLTLDQMRDDPGVTTIISVNSPRRFDDMMADGLMTMAEHGQSVAVTPFTLMGAMSPVTLAGALAQQNAEALFGVVLTQLVRPGAPVMYGAFTSQCRHALGRAGLRHAGKHQGQHRVRPAGAALQPALPHDAGHRLQRRRRARRLRDDDGAVGRGARPRQSRLPRRRLAGGRADRVVREIHHRRRDDPAHDGVPAPIEVNEGELALEALGRVPTGGHFFGEQHTLERYSTAFYQPMLSNWQNYEAWQEAGGLDATARATRLWKKALEEYVEPAMDPASARGAGGVCGASARKRSGRASREVRAERFAGRCSTLPPSVLPDISPASGGDRKRRLSRAILRRSDDWRKRDMAGRSPHSWGRCPAGQQEGAKECCRLTF